MSKEQSGPAATKRLAAIDIGSNSIRLMVAEAAADGTYRILDDEKETTRLARGLERTRVLDEQAVSQSLQALKRMKAIAEGYGVCRLEIIATSAVREAANRRSFVRKVHDQLDLPVRVVSTREEGRLSFRSVERHFDLKPINAVIVDLGGGSAELVFAAKGIVEEIHSLPLGAVRLTESSIHSDPLTKKEYDRLRRHIHRCFDKQVGKPDVWPHVMIGAGGTFMALAHMGLRMRGEAYTGIGGAELTRSEVRHVLDYLKRLPLRARKSVPGLNADRADIIVAGVLVIERLMKHLRVNRLLVHDRGIRDGLVLSMLDELFGKKFTAGDEASDPLTGVREFAAACGFEQKHSRHVAGLAVQLFDQVRERVELCDEERLILEAAAYLHEIGYLVNYQRHHLHSYHLIMHGSVRGLSPRQRELVANVARYHRRAAPKRKHENFARLNSAEQETVRRLSAILRLADGLDRTHTQRIRALHVHWESKRVLLTVTTDKLPDVDLWGGEVKGKLFEKVFGVQLEFTWQATPTTNGKSRHAAAKRDQARAG